MAVVCGWHFSVLREKFLNIVGSKSLCDCVTHPLLWRHTKVKQLNPSFSSKGVTQTDRDYNCNFFFSRHRIPLHLIRWKGTFKWSKHCLFCCLHFLPILICYLLPKKKKFFNIDIFCAAKVDSNMSAYNLLWSIWAGSCKTHALHLYGHI